MFGSLSSLASLAVNTVTGVAEVAVNGVKAGVGATIALADDSKTLDESLKGMREGISKIGKSE
jgi:hypothetical protein